MANLSKEATKFEFLLAQHKMTFLEFKAMLDCVVMHGELIDNWNKLNAEKRIEIGMYHDDPDSIRIQEDIKEGLVKIDNGNLTVVDEQKLKEKMKIN